MISTLAWRNIWRNKVRSLVMVLAITIGLFGVIFVAAISSGMVSKMIESSIENEISDLQVHDAAYVVSEQLGDVFPRSEVDPVIERNAVNIESYSFRVLAEAMVTSANGVQQVKMYGIHPGSESEVSAIASSIVEGVYFGTDTKMKEIVVGRRLVELLQVRLGSKLVLSFADADGEIRYESFRIAGIYKTNSSEFDKVAVHVNAEDLIPILATGEGNYHQLAVRIGDEQLDMVSRNFRETLEGYQVKTWFEVNPTLLAMNGLMELWTFIMVLIVLIALIFGLINTMLMVVMERRKELGMLRALGLSDRKIGRMIVLETILLGLLGGLLGNLISFVAIRIFGQRGIKFESAAEGLEQFGVGDTLYPELRAYMYLAITALVLLTALLASVFPVRRALKQDIADTLRN